MATELTMLIYGLYGTVNWPLTQFYVKRMAITGIAYHDLLVRVCHSMKRYAFEGNLMATELTMWIYCLYGTVKWPLMPFYVKRMASIGKAYHALLIRGVTV